MPDEREVELALNLLRGNPDLFADAKIGARVNNSLAGAPVQRAPPGLAGGEARRVAALYALNPAPPARPGASPPGPQPSWRVFSRRQVAST